MIYASSLRKFELCQNQTMLQFTVQSSTLHTLQFSYNILHPTCETHIIMLVKVQKRVVDSYNTWVAYKCKTKSRKS